MVVLIGFNADLDLASNLNADLDSGSQNNEDLTELAVTKGFTMKKILHVGITITS
jgi:hypothetical protein